MKTNPYARSIAFFCYLLTYLLLTDCKSTHDADEKVDPISSLDVTKDYAVWVSNVFLLHNANPNARVSVTTLGDSSLIDNTLTYTDANQPIFYVINYKNGKGWTIIAADRRMTPILAYSNSGKMGLDNIGAGLRLWIDGVAGLMKNARVNLTTPTEMVENRWKYFEKKGSISNPNGRSANDSDCSDYDRYMHQCPSGTVYAHEGYPTVEDLAGGFADSWTQKYGYAYSTPFSLAYSFLGNCSNCTVSGTNTALTGCGPLATAMVMRANYHNKGATKPSSGYNWSLMDDGLATCPYMSSGNIELSRLIRFNYDALSASQAISSCSVDVSDTSPPSAFAAAGYSNSGSVVGFNANISSVEYDLNQGYPVVISGYTCSTCGNGHMWVADGFHLDTYYNLDCSGYSPVCQESAFLYFHLNWGEQDQSGSRNAWYGVGGFVMNGDTYNTNLKATIGVRP